MSVRNTPMLRREILRYISTYYEATKCMPGYREIGAAVGLASTSSVSRHIAALRAQGLLDTLPSGRLRPANRSLDGCEGARRFRLKLADGGLICFDCYMEAVDGAPLPKLTFGGVMEAINLSSSVSRIVGCEIEDDALLDEEDAIAGARRGASD